MFPARSLQVACNTIDSPSPDDMLEVVQFAGSIPEPPALSLQCQLTVTFVRFQPFRVRGRSLCRRGGRRGLIVGAGVTAFDGAEGGPVPAPFVAVTVNV